MPEHHELMGGQLHVYRRDNSRFWQASAYLKGKNRRISTKEESLAHAKDIAEDWFLELKGKARAGLLKSGPTFKQAAAKFLDEYEVLTKGERSPRYVESQQEKLRIHLLPFFGDKVLSEITPGLVQEYRIDRMKNPRKGRVPSRSTMHSELVALRQVLKCATRHGWLEYLPDISAPYKASGKIKHRGWFSQEEYARLYKATRERAAKPKKTHRRWECEQLHDYVLFMANTGLRPDEALRLEFRDVAIVKDHDSKETILEIEVRGKRGVGFCKSTTNAVEPFRRLKKRLRSERSKDPASEESPKWVLPEPTDRLFPKNPRQLLNTVLEERGLRTDRDGNQRTAYSLRHTYICFRLMEGADIYQIAKNCRTSVEMIEKYYASHIKNTLDAAAINVRKGTLRREAERRRSAEDQAG
jgi:integrase